MTAPTDRDAPSLGEARLRVSLRAFGGAASETPGVYCPREGREMPLALCAHCEQCLGLSIDTTDRGTFLRCRWSGSDATDARTPAVIPETDLRRPTPTPVKVVMTPVVSSVRADTPLEEIVALLLRQKISAVPVVDAAGRPLGVVSKTDLLRRVHEHGDVRALDVTALAREDGVEIELGPGFHTPGAKAPKAAELMTPTVLSLTEEASVHRAAALMSYEGIHRILVVREDGSVAGILSSLDILRWLAREAGFVIPDTRTRASTT